MALTVNTNLSSLVTQRALGSSKSELDTAMERLASGKRVNTAADDAAGLSIGARMNAQVSAFRMAIRNAEDGISLAETAEGSMEEITDMLLRMRELAMAAANGTYSQDDRKSLDLEVQQLKEEIDRIASHSVFNGQSLLDGTFQSVMQVGTESSEAVTVDIANLTTDSLGGISGTTVSEAVTQASFAGSVASPTVTQLSFESNDDYTFVLELEIPQDSNDWLTNQGATGGPVTVSYNISGSVVRGGAGDVLSAINKAIREVPDHVAYSVPSTATGASAGAVDLVGSTPQALNDRITDAIAAVADSIRVSYTGKTVTLENLNGLGISVKSGTVPATSTPTNDSGATGAISRSGGAVAFTSVSGGDGSESKVLGGSGTTVTSFRNAGVSLEASVATVDLSAVTPAAGEFVFEIDSTKYTVTVSDVDSDSDVDVQDIAASVTRLNNISPALPEEFAIGASGTDLLLSKIDGTDFNFTLVSYSATSGGADLITGNAITISDSGSTAVALTAGVASLIDGGSPTDSPVTEAVMYLDFLGRDTYSFRFENNATTASVTSVVEVSYNETDAALEAIAIEFESMMSTMTDKDGNPYSFDVSVVDGRIKVVETNGTAFGITGFESESQGRVMVSNEYGQSPAGQNSALLLDDTVFADEAVTSAKAPPVRTDVTMSFSQTDTYSFTVSDGTATAVINPTVADPNDLSAFASSIRVALKQAGLEGSIDVVVTTDDENDINPLTADSIQLVHRLGNPITIKNFASTDSGEMFMQATTAGKSSDDISSGLTRILNDDTGTTSKRVKDVSITSESLASDSLAILDRAIEDINMERAFLGAIASRLQHTIDNLGNIATNTEAAKSRIMDADYASESAKLAKAQVLQQAGTAMLAQANASSQTVLSLLQG